MSQVRVLPGEPVFSTFFNIPTATIFSVCLTLVGSLLFDAVYHPLQGCIQAKGTFGVAFARKKVLISQY